MNRDDGFAVMDLDTSFFDDVKVKRLIRFAPGRAATGIMAYMACATSSWREGRRVHVEETWPAGIPFDPLALDALRHVRLIDSRGFIPPKTWRGWFEKARAGRDTHRERWRRANEKRAAETALLPRGDRAVTASTVPTVPTVSTKGIQGVDVSPGARPKPRLVDPVTA